MLFSTKPAAVATSPRVSSEIKTTTCYMCACRCGIRVHLDGGRVRYIEGNPDHPVNRGVLCAKGAAGIMQHRSPARLSAPLLRVGERGEGRFKEISWDEALALATEWLGAARQSDPRTLAFFTGRDQSQALTGWWAKQFGTPNYASHGGFCSVNMAAAGLYTIGSSFWEFGEPDWEHTKYLMLFGVCEDHSSNPLKIGLGRLKSRGQAKVVSVNPVCTGYSAIADEWIGLRPGTDGLLVLALIHELLRTERIDADYLVRYTNAPWLVIDDPGGATDGLFARDAAGNPLAFDAGRGQLVDALSAEIAPALVGERLLPDGRRARPVFELMATLYLAADYAPDAVAATIGIEAATIRRLARELADVAFDQEIVLPIAWTDWAGRRHDHVVGRPVSFHAMRGIAAHSNGFQTCRAIHVLQMLLGSIDVPGGFLATPPCPRPSPPGRRPGGQRVTPGEPLDEMPLGWVLSPDDLLIDAAGKPTRIDRAFSWEHPLAAHGALHLALRGAWACDPYPIDVLFLYMANMGWNSAMNLRDTHRYFTDKSADGRYRIPHIIYSDAYHYETVAYADLVLPDTTYLERWDCLSLLDRPISSGHGAADAVRRPVVACDRDVRPFQDVLLDLGARLKLPGMIDDRGLPRYAGGYPDYMVRHERSPGIGLLAGWRGADGNSDGRGAPNPRQLERYVENGCFWQDELPAEARYLKHANQAYLDYAQRLGWLQSPAPITFQLYLEPLQRFRLAARGHGSRVPPAQFQARIERYFEPLPIWYAPLSEAHDDPSRFPLHAITQRPMHMYHAWGSQNAWLRQITARNWLYVHPDTAAAAGLRDEDWVWIESSHGRVKAPIKTMRAMNPNTVWTWNAIGKRAGAWGLDPVAPEAREGFLLNHLIPDVFEAGDTNADPITGQAAWYDLRVRLEKCAAHECGETAPTQETMAPLPHPPVPVAVQRYGRKFDRRPSPTRAAPRYREWLGNRNEDAE